MGGYADGADYMDTGADFCTVGKGATRHVYGLTGETTWCGRVPFGEANANGQRCKACIAAIFAHFAPTPAESAIIVPSTTDQRNTDKGETEMAAKTTETTTPVDAEKVRDEISATIERLTAVAIAGEDVDPLKAEAEKLIVQLPAKDRAKLRAQVRTAADAKPAEVAKVHEGNVFHSTEVGTIDTTDYTLDAETVELRDTVAEKIVTGIRKQLAVVDVAREAARAMISLKSHIIHKGKPDLKGNSAEAKRAAREAYDRVADALSDLDEDARNEHRDAFRKSVNNVMQEETILWTRTLVAGSPEALRFRMVTGEGNEDPGAAIREAYGYPELTLSEKRKAEREIANAAKSANELEAGESDESDESDDSEGGDATPETPKDFDLIEKVEKTLAKVAKTPAGYEDSDLDRLIEEASDLGTLVSDLIARLRAEKKARKEAGE
jgi:hypothetical protein